MMTKRFITNEVHTRLTENIKSEGFEYIKSKERIMRKHSMGFDVIYARVVDYNPIFQIESSIAIRLNAVEEIVNLFLDERFLNPEFKSLTTTVSTSYMILAKASENYIEIKSEEELNSAINELITLIKNKGLGYFEKYRNIEVVNGLKKTQILNDHMSSFNTLVTLMQSLTLMKLCNDPDFEKLSMKYKELHVPFAGEEESGRKAMDDLINYLKQMQ